LHAGEAAGLLEAIGGVLHPSDLVAVTQTRILRCPTAALIDVLEGHSDLGLTIVHNLATHLLDAVVERDLHDHLS
jgi:CRP-like cAMP-binding protein